MKLVTAEEMQKIDRIAIDKYGIPAAMLMERAGLVVAEKVRSLFKKKRVLVLAGGGNNGGDGIVAARILHNWGWDVRVLLMLREDKLSPDCLAQYRIARQSGVAVEFRKAVTEKDLHDSIVVDALLGTGINKIVTSFLAEVIRSLNASDAAVVAVDIPSGISADNGQIMGEAVRSDYTVTFGLPKVGHLLHPGAEYTGQLFIENIGFPPELLSNDDLSIELLGIEAVSMLVPERPRYSHKGDYGHILVVAGSRGKTGAALMTARACLRTGGGMVTLGVPESLLDVYQARVTEEMVLPLPDTGRGTFAEEAYETIIDFLDKKADVLAIGPGITGEKASEFIVKRLLETATVPMVLDADAVNVLAGNRGLLKKVKAPVVLTPHTGEMVRLLSAQSVKNDAGETEKELRTALVQNSIGLCRKVSAETGTYLVLKGAPTIVADPEGRVFINSTGNPGMATAGSGDVLTGMIAALIGQSMPPLEAAQLGVYLHGLAGDLAAEMKGMHSLMAGDIIEAIPAAFLALHV